MQTSDPAPDGPQPDEAYEPLFQFDGEFVQTMIDQTAYLDEGDTEAVVRACLIEYLQSHCTPFAILVGMRTILQQKFYHPQNRMTGATFHEGMRWLNRLIDERRPPRV